MKKNKIEPVKKSVRATSYKERFGEYPIASNINRIAGLMAQYQGSQSSEMAYLDELAYELRLCASALAPDITPPKTLFSHLKDGQHFMYGNAEHVKIPHTAIGPFIQTHLNDGKPYRTNHVNAIDCEKGTASGFGPLVEVDALEKPKCALVAA